MIYRVKNQKNEMGTFVLYDTERMPQTAYAQVKDDVVEFDSPLERAVFFTKLFVEGFGGALLFADNCKEGYEPSEEPLDFYYAKRFQVGALAYAGLLDEQENPKPAYYGLKYIMQKYGVTKHPLR